MSRAVIFDWGGVLMRTMDIRPRMAWERRLGLPPGALADAFFGSPAWDRAQRGDASLDDVWAEVAAWASARPTSPSCGGISGPATGWTRNWSASSGNCAPPVSASAC